MPASAPATAPPRITVSTERSPASAVDLVAAWQRLTEKFGPEGAFLLESRGGPAADCRYAMLGFRPLLTVTVRRGAVRLDGEPAVAAAALAAADGFLQEEGTDRVLERPDLLWDMLRAVQDRFAAPSGDAPQQFGFLSFFGYDTIHYVEKLPRLIAVAPDDAEVPDICLVLHQGRIRTDLATGVSELFLHRSDAWSGPSCEEIQDLLQTLPQPDADARAPLPEVPGFTCRDDTTREDYLQRVDTCLGHIAAGDVYQIQIGHELTVTSTVEPLDVYRRLRASNPSPYSYLAPVAGQLMIGASPELFARVEDGELVMRPIAGTLPHRPGSGTAPDTAAAGLLADPKEIAEHIMLVDLCRNDIGQVCDRGTLAESGMFSVERYSHVLHLVSTVTGRVGEADGYDVVRALFPSGTMTGAPKLRAMEIIESMESSRRGWYAGSVGLLDFDGSVNLALCIRTLLHADGRYRTRASAGIVADSVPGREWRETLAKMSAAYWAVTGKELLS
ncbi:anthranilate synthase component I family protein [Streptomyces sp. bgisy027]|uniref:anthranilate synthase component I family protein n=1 Tax=Streptomyces sp. bgisy027 TaxID=3413770 RepID=UPI003D703E34